jgi:hypothetical protein
MEEQMQQWHRGNEASQKLAMVAVLSRNVRDFNLL